MEIFVIKKQTAKYFYVSYPKSCEAASQPTALGEHLVIFNSAHGRLNWNSVTTGCSVLSLRGHHHHVYMHRHTSYPGTLRGSVNANPIWAHLLNSLGGYSTGSGLP